MDVLTKAQGELLDAAKSLVHYLELVASGAIVGPVDPQAKCISATEDAIRLVKHQGIQRAQLADASGEPSDDAARIAGIRLDLVNGEVRA